MEQIVRQHVRIKVTSGARPELECAGRDDKDDKKSDCGRHTVAGRRQMLLNRGLIRARVTVQ